MAANGASSPQGGYPVEIFPGAFDEKFRCNSCTRILRDPVQSFCGHRFCRSCINAVISKGERVQCQSCISEGAGDDDDYSILKEEQMFPDNGVRREMANKEVRCLNQGCKWTDVFKNYDHHASECEYRLIACPECQTMVEKANLEKHLKENCLGRKMNCKTCNQEIAIKDESQHNKVCPKALVKCEACGKKKILREKLGFHQEKECASQKINCPVGCDPVERGAFIGHLERKSGIHIQWMLQQIETLIREVNEKIQPLTPIDDINRMVQMITVLQAKIQEQDNQIRTLMEQPRANNQQEIIKLTKQAKALDLKTGTFEGIVTTLHREIERCITALDTLERHRNSQQDVIEELKKKTQHMERAISLKDVTISELDSRIRSLEIISYEGTLVWKIAEWSKHRREAMAGRVTSLYSPHFYTGRTGYRLCARLYPNGDGIGKKTHVSVFFVVARGNYDALLSWPFIQRVTFMLLDQNNRDHVVDSFRPDPASSSFQRPTTEMNIASGCPLFVPLKRLEEVGTSYVKDDTLFLKIVVDSERPSGGGGV
ncbi:TNF receptor-associated factor 2-like [Ylistrum balloti]|uniref:TNF receptor-associated factor 2-like n=1 Tax=Ylistrum balloti TaxID=509963 RepID=UPI002905EA5A|nr:TNF receptor-associated factor 2-like [Ylistrum balloti]